jgi:hypothetical protein
VPHEVYGRLEGRVAVLDCKVCGESALLQANQFDDLGAFMERHRLCVRGPGGAA